MSFIAFQVFNLPHSALEGIISDSVFQAYYIFFSSVQEFNSYRSSLNYSASVNSWHTPEMGIRRDSGELLYVRFLPKSCNALKLSLFSHCTWEYESPKTWKYNTTALFTKKYNLLSLLSVSCFFEWGLDGCYCPTVPCRENVGSSHSSETLNLITHLSETAYLA